MNFQTLISEFTSEGFDYLEASKAERFLNDAYLLDICEGTDWPFLEVTAATGAAPLTLSEVASISYVLDTTQQTKLKPLDPRNVSDESPSMTTEGTPQFYYLTGEWKLNVYPLNTTDTLSVAYRQMPARLSGTSTPVLPERFHSLIIDGACARAYSNSDDWELRQSAKAAFREDLQVMKESLLNLDRDGPDDFVTVTDPLAF